MSNYTQLQPNKSVRPNLSYHIVDQVQECESPSEAAIALVESIDEFKERLLQRARELEAQLAELNNALSKLP